MNSHAMLLGGKSWNVQAGKVPARHDRHAVARVHDRLQRLRRIGTARSEGGHRSEPDLARAGADRVADGQHRARSRLEAGRNSHRGRGLRSQCLRHRTGPSALAVRAAQRRRAGGRDQRPAWQRRSQGHQGQDHGLGDAEGRCRRAQPEPHQVAARCRRRWRRRTQDHLPPEPGVPVWHGAGRRHALRRQCRCGSPCAVSHRRHADQRRAGQGRRPPGQG